MTVLPQAAMSLKTDTTVVAVNESKPVVGSSRKIKSGSVMISTPIDAHFLSPPDTPLTIGPPILVSAAFCNLSSSNTSSTIYL